MKTKFVSKPVTLADGTIIHFDGNSKIAVDTSYDDPYPNAFSLISIDDCPYSTPVCRSSCYTAGLKQHAPDLFAKYEQNSQIVRKYLDTDRNALLNAFHAHLVDEGIKSFRWHVSGDIFSEKYASFIRTVADANPQTHFWIYTRSFPYLAHLVGPKNLVVNLSGDIDNIEECKKAQAVFPETRICFMSTDGSVPSGLRNDSVIFPDYNLRGRDLERPTEAPWWGTLTQPQKRMVCPPDFFGQSDKLRCGPCTKCIDQTAVKLSQIRLRNR